jgi:hypothetical protein
MKRFLNQHPERALRGLVIAFAAAAPLAALCLLRARTLWQQPWVFMPLVLGATLLLLRGELQPALADEEPARRAARYAYLVPGLILAIAFAFPIYVSWAALWLLALCQVGLLVFAHAPSVRPISLITSAVLALGLTVLNEPSAWTLLPAGLGLLLVPALNRLAQVRLGIAARVRPQLGHALGLLFGVAALGVAVFAVAMAILPPSANDYSEVGLLVASSTTKSLKVADVPITELFVLLGLVVVFLLVLRGMSGGEGAEEQLEEATLAELARVGGRAAPLVNSDTRAWPQGARRRVVEGYLQHLRRVEVRLSRGVADTPRSLSQRLPEPLRPVARALAERFGLARWGPEPVSEACVEALAAEVAAIEAGLAQPEEAEES